MLVDFRWRLFCGGLAALFVAADAHAFEILVASSRSLGGDAGIYRIDGDGQLDTLLSLAAGSGVGGTNPTPLALDEFGGDLLFTLSGDPGLYRLGAGGGISRADAYDGAANPQRLAPVGAQRVTTDASGNAYLFRDSWQNSYRLDQNTSVDAAWEESLDGIAVSSSGDVYTYGSSGFSHYATDGSIVSTLDDEAQPSSRDGALHLNDIALDDANDLLYASRTRWDRQTGQRSYFLQAFDVSNSEIELLGTNEVNFPIQSLAVDSDSGRLFASAFGFVDGVAAVYELSASGEVLDTVAVTGGVIWDLAVVSDDTAAAFANGTFDYEPAKVEAINGSGLPIDPLVTFEQPTIVPVANPNGVVFAVDFVRRSRDVGNTDVPEPIAGLLTLTAMVSASHFRKRTAARGRSLCVR